MKRFTFILAVLVTGMFFLYGAGYAQQSQHHPNSAMMNNSESSGAHGMMGQGGTNNCPANGTSQNQGMMGMMHNMMQGGMMGNMHGASGMMGNMHGMNFQQIGSPAFLLRSAEQLKLTDDQVQNLKNLQADFQKFRVRNQADREIVEIDLQNLMKQNSVDYKVAKNKISQLTELEKQFRLEQLNKVEQSRKLLTAEQVSKLNELTPGSYTMGHGMHGAGTAMH